MTDSFDHIRAIVWDLDGTLYRYSDHFVELCNEAAARTAVSMGLPVTFDEALALARRSLAEHGNSLKFFAEMTGDPRAFFHAYHDAVDTTILHKNLELKTALERLNVPMVILTNASRPWAARTIAHLEFDHLFPQTHVLGLEDVNYQSKAHSQDGFRKALDILGSDAQVTLMVEDLAANLVQAKSLGMTTALVHPKEKAKRPIHVDHVFEDTLDLVSLLAR